MRYLKLSLIMLILPIVFLITGCGGGQQATTSPITYQSTGTQGIVVNFIPDQPPTKTYTGSELSVLAQVKNQGNFDVQNVNVYLTGFDHNILRIPAKGQTISSLEGKSAFNPVGDMTNVEFKTSGEVVLTEGMPYYRPNLLLSACYLYETKASPMACVDPRPQYTLEDKACTVTNLDTGGSQGAPIAITSIESQATPSDMIYRIHIANVGGGQVYDKTAYSRCPFELDYSDLDKIRVTDVSLGGAAQKGECQPSGENLRLVNGQATLFCKFPQQGGQAYQTPLNIELEYGYKSSVQKQIEIENLDR